MIFKPKRAILHSKTATRDSEFSVGKCGGVWPDFWNRNHDGHILPAGVRIFCFLRGARISRFSK